MFHQMNMMKTILITLTIENVRYQTQLAVALLIKHNLMKMTGVKMKQKFPVEVTDTMLTATHFLEENEPHCVFNVAPAEGNRSLSVFRDKHSEELAYPGIFLREKRADNDERLTPVYYSDICKSEVRRSDRRAATCVENLFLIKLKSFK